MTRAHPLTVLPLVLLVVTAGCLGGAPVPGADEAPPTSAPLVHGEDAKGQGTGASGGGGAEWPPENATWDTSGPYSRPLQEGPYAVREPKVYFVESFDGTRIASAVWRPDVPEGRKVPVILHASVDFNDADQPETPYVEKFWLEGIVPHGFAYAQVSVRGTGDSGGCNAYFAPDTQRDLDAVVSHYGNLSWSNGAVGMWGVSDAGTTPWMAAATGNPHLKTIVPVSGLTSVWHQTVRNGTPTALATALPLNQWARWVVGDDDGENTVGNAACPGAAGARGAAIGESTAITGAYEDPVAGDYWRDRNFRGAVLDNYEGSVFLVHGLQDWITPPNVGFPFLNALNDSGNRVKVLLGQWHHGYPDDASNRDGRVRWDFAETLLRWLSSELKGHTMPAGPPVAVQDDQMSWRTEERWPPRDARWVRHHLGASVLTRNVTDAGELVLASPADAQELVDDAAPEGHPSAPRPTEYRASTGPLEAPLRFAGAARLHVTVSPSSPGGARLYAELLDVAPGASERLVTHAVMDLRYHGGGTEGHTLTPGEPVVARMEFYPADAVIPEGHTLALRLVNGVGYTPERHPDAGSPLWAPYDTFVEHPTPAPVVLEWGAGKSVLDLPRITRDVGDGTYPGQP